MVQNWTSATGSKKCRNTLGLGIPRQEDTLFCFGFDEHPCSPTIIGLGTTAKAQDWMAESQLIVRNWSSQFPHPWWGRKYDSQQKSDMSGLRIGHLPRHIRPFSLVLALPSGRIVLK